MEILRLEQVSKSFGDKLLFSDINLTITTGQKIALVAKNGSGKTTLLRLIAGEESPEGENAKIFVSKEIRVCYLKQNADFPQDATIDELIFMSDHPKLKALKSYNEAQFSEDKSLIAKTLARVEDLNAWEIENRYKEILSKFSFYKLDQKVSTLSGGEQKRLSIAKVLIDEPEFLILDEPTNHLDIEMIEWLEQFLSNPKLSLFMVTHDRYFLDRVCNEIIEIDQQRIFSYKGNYTQFLEKKAMRHQNDLVNKEKLDKLYKKELDWVRKSPSARTTKAKSRVDKFEEIEKQAKKKLDQGVVEIPIKTQRLGSKILEAHAISKSFDDRCLIDQFSYKFKKSEKVGIVGPNGAGKTTFLSLLTKELRPDAGKVVVGDTVVFGYFRQEGLVLEKDKRVIDVIRDIAEYLPLDKGQKLSAEGLLERFLFSRDQQRVYVSQLSGGEKRRLHLLAVLMENPNFLILDEPTNDLDIMTLNVLEDYLENFPGVVLIVSHDRFLLDKLADHLFILKGNGEIKDFNGTYSEYRRDHKIELNKKPKENQQDQISVKQDENKLSLDQKKKYKNRLRKLERTLEDLQSEDKKIMQQFEDQTAPTDDIPKLSKRLNDIKSEIESAEMEWLEISEILD